jgi:UDP-GlcNAc:undecaprenyl-phosphate GlcNAc-1-phosphate transferase
MATFILVATVSFGVCLVLTPAVRSLAARVGLVDRPDHHRKVHARATPVAGGIAILPAVTLALLVGLSAPGPLRGALAAESGELTGLLAAGLISCAVGLIDDRVSLRGRYKLLGQAMAAAVLMAGGVMVHRIRLFGWGIDLGLLAAPFTLLWLLGVINSLNLIDGMDGLLSSVGLIVTVALGVMALLGEHWVAACVACALAGALLAFLGYNFPPASIFLGDSGSMLIGLIVGTLAIRGGLKAPATLTLVAPLAVLTVPLFDTSMAIVRRKLTGRSIYTPDRSHLHHCLQRRGLSDRRVLLLVAACSTVAGAGGLASLFFSSELVAVITALAVALTLIATRLFGHTEVVLVKEWLTAFLGPLAWWRARGEPCEMRVRLQGCASWEDLWSELMSCAADLRLIAVEVDVNAPAIHEWYFASWWRPGRNPPEGGLWRTEVPLILDGLVIGRVRVSGAGGAVSLGDQIALVTKVIHCFTPALPGGQPDSLGAVAPAVPPDPGAAKREDKPAPA